ncbi:hypothetical protein LCGC14_1430030 [marine sediment metagenome]|uniref:N-acetyltransferase domain-containing protein n=1 Tax=marine sediment metagenome TaxID=412755 RepID=A0A0F9JP65_9ZZZZ
MIILREYIPDDWTKIDDAVEPFMFLEPFERFDEIVQKGLAVTAIEDDIVMACGGVSYVDDQEGVVWMKISKKCFCQPYRWGRTIRETFSLMAKSLGAMRIVTYILKGFCKGERLARLIGMTKTDKEYEFNDNIYRRYTVVI